MEDIHISILAENASFPSSFRKCGNSSCSCGGSLFHCHLCPTDSKKGTKASQLKTHFQIRHWNDRVIHRDKTILRCNLNCTGKNRSHWHCSDCCSIFTRQTKLTAHLTRHIRPLKTPSIKTYLDTSKHGNRHSSSMSKKTQDASRDNSQSCSDCKKMFPNRPALQRHVREQHKKKLHGAIHAGKHLNGVCVDIKRGIFMVSRAFSGTGQPIHCQHATNETPQPVYTICELDSCREATRVERLSGQPAYECVHLRSIQYCRPYERAQALLDSSLEEIAGGILPWLKESRKEECIAHRDRAFEEETPLVVRLYQEEVNSQRYIHLSVWDGKVHYYSRFRRVVVTYDKKMNRWMCACCRSRINCLHKSVGKWFLYQTDRQSIDTETAEPTENADLDSGESDDYDDVGLELGTTSCINGSDYPPTGGALLEMVEYIYKEKKLPINIPKSLLTLDLSSNIFIPSEMECCQMPLTGPFVISRRAVIITSGKVIKGAETFYKRCSSCSMVYRYQDSTKGLYNYDDRHIFSIEFMLFLRAFVKENTAVGRSIAALKGMTEELSSIPDSIFRNAYLHFEALSDHRCQYFCYKCGHHPPILIWDLCKKGCFSLTLNDLEVPDVSEENDKVDMEDFWSKIDKHIIVKGLLKGQQSNPIPIEPSYKFWAPWIGPFSRCGTTVYNTEYRKVAGLPVGDQGSPEPTPKMISEEDLVEMMQFSQLKTLQKTCRDQGISNTSTLSKIDCVSLLRKKLGVPENFKKIFSKIWGASGGWASGSCPHLVIYCLKFVLRGESPRDYADLLRSLKYPPSISISDIPHRLARHTNNTVPDFFRPNDGRLFEANADNITLVEESKLEIHMPWLVNDTSLSESASGQPDDVHPVTGQKDRFSLTDRFHERNSSDRADLLRSTTLVPELNGVVNTEAEEQMHRSLNCFNYSLNNMKPVHHMFMMRLKIHLSNQSRNITFKKMLEKTFSDHAGGVKVELQLNEQGKLQKAKDIRSYGFKANGSVLAEHRKTTTKSSGASFVCDAQQTPTVVLNDRKHEKTEQITRDKPVGIENISQSCWFGALISCISNTLLADWVIGLKDEDEGSLVGQISGLIIKVKSRTEGPPLDPETALAFFHSLEENLQIGEQQDVHEALTLLLSAINPERVHNPCRAVLSATFQCLECEMVGDKTETWDHYSMGVEMSQSGLQGCLDRNDTKLYPGNVSKECTACQKNTKHAMWMSFLEEPELLLVHVKRFDISGNKDSRNLNVTETLNIGAFIPSLRQTKYALVAAILHKGRTTTSGHYTAVNKKGECWFLSDDASVTEINSGKLLDLCKKEAYLLFYQNIEGIEDCKPDVGDLPLSENGKSENEVEITSLKNDGSKKSQPNITGKEKFGTINSSLVLISQQETKMIEDYVASLQTDHVLRFDGSSIRNVVANDLRNLVDREKELNGFIVNEYIRLLVDAVNRSQRAGKMSMLTSYCFSEMRKAIRTSSSINWNSIVSKDLINKSKVIAPVHVELDGDVDHWCLSLADIEKETILYFDPIGSGTGYKESTETMRQLLSNVFAEVGMDTWTAHLINDYERFPLQKTNYDCGVFICLYAVCMFLPNMSFIQSEIPSLRKQMAYEIVRGKLMDGIESKVDQPIKLIKGRPKRNTKRVYKSAEYDLSYGQKRKPKELKTDGSDQESAGVELTESEEELYFMTDNIQNEVPSTEGNVSGDSSDEESIDDDKKEFVKNMMPHLESLERDTVSGERIKARKLLHRNTFKKLHRDEDYILYHHFGNELYVKFKRELQKSYTEKIPENEMSDFELATSYNNTRTTVEQEVLDAVFLPELMVQYKMLEKELSFDQAMNAIFKKSGHTIFFDALNKIAENDVTKQASQNRSSRRKAGQPRRIAKERR